MDSTKLSSAERDEIFTVNVWPYFAHRLVPQEKPEAHILGGQPGAGKSHFLRVLKEQSKDSLIINGDDLRGLHPFFYSYLREDERGAVDRVQEDISSWVEKLIEEISHRKGNLIVEGTMRNPAAQLRTADVLEKEGYSVSAHVILTRPEISMANIFLRYEMQKRLLGVARLTRHEAHDETVERLSDNIVEICRSPKIGRVGLYRRKTTDYELLYERVLASGISTEVDEEKLRVLLENERKRELLEDEKEYVSRTWETAFLLARERGADKEYLEELDGYRRGERLSENRIKFH